MVVQLYLDVVCSMKSKDVFPNNANANGDKDCEASHWIPHTLASNCFYYYYYYLEARSLEVVNYFSQILNFYFILFFCC